MFLEPLPSSMLIDALPSHASLGVLCVAGALQMACAALLCLVFPALVRLLAGYAGMGTILSLPLSLSFSLALSRTHALCRTRP